MRHDAHGLGGLSQTTVRECAYGMVVSREFFGIQTYHKGWDAMVAGIQGLTDKAALRQSSPRGIALRPGLQPADARLRR